MPHRARAEAKDRAGTTIAWLEQEAVESAAFQQRKPHTDWARDHDLEELAATMKSKPPSPRELREYDNRLAEDEAPAPGGV